MAKYKPGPKGSYEGRSRSRFGGSRDRGASRGFGRGGSRGGFGDREGGRGRGKVEMYDVICDKCGKNCEVPFKPTGNKPVLCSDCFRQSDRGDRSGSRFSGQGRPFPSPVQSSMSSEQLKQINEKLDKILRVLQELEMAEVDEEDDDDSEEDEDGDEVEKKDK